MEVQSIGLVNGRKIDRIGTSKKVKRPTPVNVSIGATIGVLRLAPLRAIIAIMVYEELNND